jgi:chromosome segregation ATPase
MSLLDKDKTIHNIEECPQAPVLENHGRMMERHGDMLQRLEHNSNEFQEQFKKQTELLERIAETSTMVKSHEKRIDVHENMIDTIFRKHRALDERVVSIEIKDAEARGEKHGEQIAIEKDEKDHHRIWTLLERLQLLTPVILFVFFILWCLIQSGLFIWIWKQTLYFTGSSQL